MSTAPNILVWGANSAIAQEVQKLFANQKSRFFLVARNAEKLAAIADDLTVRGAEVCGTAHQDFNQYQGIEAVVNRAATSLGRVDIILVAHGSLPDQAICERSAEAVKTCIDDNFTSSAIILQSCAHLLHSQGNGTLAVISSVAGDRGRKSNYMYGSAKAGIDALLQGLRGRFAATDIKIVNIKPGMVKTPMTAGMKQGLLWSTPEAIAPAIVKAMSTGRAVSYVPGYWRFIMCVIRALPTAVLARLPI